MLKLTVTVNDCVVLEQTGDDYEIANFTPNPARVLATVKKQNWYGFISEHDGITTFYKIQPVNSEKFLPQTA